MRYVVGAVHWPSSYFPSSAPAGAHGQPLLGQAGQANLQFRSWPVSQCRTAGRAAGAQQRVELRASEEPVQGLRKL